MTFTVTGSPVRPFVDAVKTLLVADSTLEDLLGASGKITGHVDDDEPLDEPYLVLGHRGSTSDAGAMQLPGNRVSLQLDVFSAHKGPSEAADIQSRVRVLLNRATVLVVAGFDVVQGSLDIEFEDIFDEFDSDMPDAGSIYHGVQRLVAEIHEAS